MFDRLLKTDSTFAILTNPRKEHEPMVARSFLTSMIVGSLVLCLCKTSAAVPMAPLSSESFTYKYEMDVQPSSLDLDSNASSDWFGGVSGGATEPVVSGGLAPSDQSVSPQERLFRTDSGGSLTRATVTSDFTIETRVKLIAGTQDGGDVGTFGIALQQPSQGQSLRLNIDENEVSFNGGGTGAITTGSNTDNFHVFRVAFEGTNNYWVWRDNTLLNSDLDTPFTGSNGNFNNSGSWLVGDFSGSLSGEWIVDYIRVTEGSFAAVPEPSTLVLCIVGFGSVMLFGRRKRTLKNR